MTARQRAAPSSERYVLLHGTPGDSSVWSQVLALAPAGAECLCIDLPDHGRAEDEPGADTGALETRLAHAVEALGPHLVLVGHSYGAYLSARLAVRLPAQIRRVVLISGLATLPAARAAAFVEMAGQLQSGELELDALSATVTAIWYGAAASAEQHREVSALLRRTGQARLLRLLSRLAQLARPEFAARAYAAPAHVVHAEQDAAVPLELGEQLSRLAPSAELSIVPGVSHMLPLTHAETIAAAIFAR